MTNRSVYCISITFRDDENNRFIHLGGAGWNTREEWNDEWNKIPSSRAGSCIVDKIDENGNIVEDRFVSIKTVESLLGGKLSQLIENGRRL